MQIGSRVLWTVSGYAGVDPTKKSGTVAAISGCWVAVLADHLVGTPYSPFLIQPMDRFEVVNESAA